MIQEISNFISKDLCNQIISAGSFPSKSYVEDMQYYFFENINRSSNVTCFHEILDLFDNQTNKIIPFFPYRWLLLMKYPAGIGLIYRHKDTYGPTAEYEKKSYSMLLYLNDIKEGGETVIFDGDKELIIKPEPGKLLIMSGDIEHEARRPISNDKYVLLSRHN